jgi:hypothetical protein
MIYIVPLQPNLKSARLKKQGYGKQLKISGGRGSLQETGVGSGGSQ